jgi:glycosyltransferase involved in cell wall biosynthesis
LAERVLVGTYIRLLALLSNKIVVQTDGMRNLLRMKYGLPPNKVRVVKYGVRAVNRTDTNEAKKQLRITDRFCLFAPSLLRQGSGIEHVLRALPELISKIPNLLFVIATPSSSFYLGGDHYFHTLNEMVTPAIKDNVLFLRDFYALDPESGIWVNASDLLVYLHEAYPSEEASLSVLDAISYAKPALVSDASKFAEVASALKLSNLGQLVVPLTGLDPSEAKNLVIGPIESVRKEIPSERVRLAYERFFQDRTWNTAAFEFARIYFELVGRLLKIEC